jgi:hypothetical protein
MLFIIWMHILEGLRLHIGINIPLSISVQSMLRTIVIRVVTANSGTWDLKKALQFTDFSVL